MAAARNNPQQQQQQQQALNVLAPTVTGLSTAPAAVQMTPKDRLLAMYGDDMINEEKQRRAIENRQQLKREIAREAEYENKKKNNTTGARAESVGYQPRMPLTTAFLTYGELLEKMGY